MFKKIKKLPHLFSGNLVAVVFECNPSLFPGQDNGWIRLIPVKYQLQAISSFSTRPHMAIAFLQHKM